MSTPLATTPAPTLLFTPYHLLAMADIIGLHITEVPKGKTANLYVWCRPDGGIIYIGKSDTPSRVANEIRWVDNARSQISDHTFAAFCTVMIRQQAAPIALYYDAEKSNLNKAKDLSTREEWDGDMVDQLLAYQGQLTVSEVEKILIRMPLATGNFTANSTDTGLWGNRLSRFWDHLAQLAAIEAGYRDF
ncbi:hypothetical protein [Corynebacterium callunae]|uniref:Uncharacterized protein n=1 Tax=Corynebacterium callunae DSM 20147 TaxID=1121353 RepID=M1UHY5_9CORY|nr:hypothetical protein [Corynebacterium callunae]AGG68055.1 hypothetical protein H924_13330 [Corynebacterium callunae DSM 20147]